MKKSLFIIFIIILFAFFIGFYFGSSYFNNKNITGNVILDEKEYSWTKAICNANNECIDVSVYCKGKEIVKIEPVSKLIKFDISFIDTRNSSDKWC